MKKIILPVALAFLVGCSSSTSAVSSVTSTEDAVEVETESGNGEYSFPDDQRTVTYDDKFTITFNRAYFNDDGNFTVDYTITNNFDVEILVYDLFDPSLDNVDYSTDMESIVASGETVDDTMVFEDSSDIQGTELNNVLISFIVYDHEDQYEGHYTTELYEDGAGMDLIKN